MDLPPCDPIEVTVPPEVGVSYRTGVQIHRAELPRTDLCLRQGLILTKPMRTVTDLARTRDLVEAVVALDMALHQRLVASAALHQFLEQNPGARGTAVLRRAVALAEPATESPMETRLRLLLLQAKLPRPLVQASLHDSNGRLLGRADLYYPAQRLVIEYDGDTHRDSLIPDNRRQNALIVAGYNVLRFTAPDVYTRPETVVALVRSELNRIRHPGGGY